MRILIIGSNGLLGSDLVEDWAGDTIIPATSRDADIRDLSELHRLASGHRPAWIILAAGYTDVDASERDPALAFAINRDGTRNVSVVARELGAKLCFLSTDYVFDGASTRPYEPEDPVNPLNVYGASKAAGEKAVQEQAGHWLIVRTSWLFGASKPCFPEKILHAADSRPDLKVVTDQIGSPTYTRDLSSAIRALVRADARGLLHITNTGACSWFDFAKETLQRAGRNTSISPVTSEQVGRPARRPVYSVLSSKASADRGIVMPNWQKALDNYLSELRRKGKLS
jgi:dTDP-4-dehydrorhamnose reductase